MPFFKEDFDENGAAEGIRTAWQKNRLMEDMGEDLADLRYGVGKNLDNERDDVAKVESMLALTGDLDVDEMVGIYHLACLTKKYMSLLMTIPMAGKSRSSCPRNLRYMAIPRGRT